MRYQSKGNLHPDFHGATCTTIEYIIDNFGKEALQGIFEKVGSKVYKTINHGLKAGDFNELFEFWEYYLQREDGKYQLEKLKDGAVLTIHECPAIKHLAKLGMSFKECYCEQTRMLNQGLCKDTPYEIVTEKLSECSCRQIFRRRERCNHDSQ
jgi:hypothetical protein